MTLLRGYTKPVAAFVRSLIDASVRMKWSKKKPGKKGKRSEASAVVEEDADTIPATPQAILDQAVEADDVVSDCKSQAWTVHAAQALSRLSTRLQGSILSDAFMPCFI